MNYLKSMYSFFKKKEIDDTNNAIEFTLDTREIVRAINEYFFCSIVFYLIYFCAFVSQFLVFTVNLS